MKKFFFTLLLLTTAILCHSSDFSYYYMGKTLNYNILTDSTCEVTYAGREYNRSNINNTYVGPSGNIVIPSYAVDNQQVSRKVVRIGAHAFHYTINNNNFIYSVSIPNTITSIGEMAFGNCTRINGTFVIPNEVVSIESWAFQGCIGIDSLYIGTNITSIGRAAFVGCTGLQYINYNAKNCTSELFGLSYNSALYNTFPPLFSTLVIGDSVQIIPSYFAYNRNTLSTIIIPDNVNYIGQCAFFNCSSLESLTMGSGLNIIENSAFQGCSSLTSLIIPDSVTSIGNSAFRDCSSLESLIIGTGLNTIENSVFQGCTSLISLIIPNSVTSIGNSAFRDCSSLESLTIGPSLNIIEASAFQGCSSLSSLIIPDSVTSIGNSAFRDCSSLESLTINTGLNIIEDSVFQYCSSLSSIIISDSVTSIGNNAFYGCSGLDSLYLGSGMKTIGSYAFYNCTNIHKLVIPDSVTSIGNSAFYGCSGIDSLYFGIGLKTIGSNAFDNCTNIHKLVIPDGVTSIGSYAFDGCSGIDSLYLGSGLNTIENYAFQGCSGLKYMYYNAKNCTSQLFSTSNDSPFYNTNTPYFTTLVIGDSVRSIPHNAFYNRSSLEKLTILDNVTSIGASAFYGCSGIVSLWLGSGLTSIGSSAFQDCSGLRFMYYNAKNCATQLFRPDNSSPFCNTNTPYFTTLVIGDSVRSIPHYAFYNRSSLEKLTIPDNVTSIGAYAFYGCSSIDSLWLGSGLISIGNYAFQRCSDIHTLTIPDSIISIGAYAFAECNNLTNTITGLIHTLGNRTFYNCDNLLSITSNANSIGRDAFANCDRLVTVTLGDSVQTLGNGAFSGCFRLQNIDLGGVTAIGDSAFAGCVRLEQPELPAGLQTIGRRAFDNCNVLAGKLTFPATVTNIGDYAYNGVGTITEIEMQGANPPTIYAHTFNSVSNSVPVSVPCGAVLSYYTTNYWEIFPNIVEAPPYRLTLATNNETMGSAAATQQPTCSNHSAIIQATAQTGYHFLQWNDGNTSNPRTIQMTQDSSFTAIFVQNNSYITAESNDPLMGSVSGSGLYSYNAPVTLTASAIDGYHFLKWNDDNTQNPRYMVAVRDTSFTAIFVSNVSNITVANANPDMGNVSGSGIYYYQNLVSITATPVYGYHFAQWNDGNSQNPRTITVNQDSNFTAYFAPNLYNINAASNSTVMGSVSGGGSYTYMHNMSLTATPAFGYHFVQWNDQVTDNPRTITVTRDSAFTAQFAANSYAITAESNDPTMGSAYGSGSYNFNASATLTAVAEYGYHFTQWSDGVTDNPRTVTVQNSATYTAQFEINSYIITVQSSNPAIGTTSGGGSYNYLTPVNITANPNAGYHFTQWSDGNTDNPRLVSVTQNATYIAQFAINSYAVSVQSSNTNMGSVSGSGTYNHNSTATLTATAYYGYHFVQWQDGNTQNPRTVTVTDSAQYTAEFAYNSYLVCTNSSNVTLGTATGGGSYNYLSQVALTAVAAPHYHFTMWNDSIEDNPRTITVTRDTVFTAHFAIDRHTVDMHTADATQGSVSSSDTVDYNTAVWITATANYGYHFTQWNDGNTQNPRRVVVLQDTAFTALFAPNQYTATCTVNDNTRGIVATTGGSFNYLTQITFTAQPTANYHFLRWSNGSTDNPITFTLTQDTTLTAILVGLSAQTSDSTMGTALHSKTSNLVETVTAVANYGYHFVQWNDGNTDNPRTINLTGDTTVTAFFAINQYLLTVESNDNALGTVTGSGEYNYLSQVTISATAATHSHFTQWSDGSTTNPRLITLTSDTAFTAIFEADPQYQITVVANDSFFGTVSGSGTYYQGETATITATANEHYYFAQWSDGVSTNPRMVTVTGDATYTAVFEPVMYTVTVEANDYTMGQVAGSGSYAYGSTATIEARAFGGYHFTGWSDGDTTAKRNITVTEDISLTATFVPNVGIGDVAKPDYNVYVQYGHIIVEGVDKERVRIFDITGRPYSHEDHLPAGVYLVRIDNSVTKKVVVL